tara:strand:+ start:66 stop:266 length:201 start_codon:yes stop_codon:yes gene_type:complete
MIRIPNFKRCISEEAKESLKLYYMNQSLLFWTTFLGNTEKKAANRGKETGMQIRSVLEMNFIWLLG